MILSLVDGHCSLATGSAAVFCARTATIADAKLQCVMQTLMIKRGTTRMMQPRELDIMKGTRFIHKIVDIFHHNMVIVHQWMDKKSEFYSRICEFSVTRRLVIRMNVLAMSILTGIICAEQLPVITVACLAVASLLVYQLNKEEKGGKE